MAKPLETLDDATPVTETVPQDRLVDRRSFLARMAALTAAGSAASVLPPIRAHAAPAADGGTGVASSVRPAALADPTECTIAEAGALIRSRRLSPVDLVEAVLARITTFDGVYKAFNTVLADAARAEAASLARARWRGPLHGVPIAVKDNYYTAGVLTTANSYIFEEFVPAWDATAVARLKAAGAIVIGKTQMGPLATTRATTPDGIITTVNAWTPSVPSVDPGGSSSGSACAVASRMATSSIGTQTGGSITAPSNRQALTGLKPTHGRVPAYGVIPLSYTRDHPGPLARDAKDAAIMLSVMAGPDENDMRTLGLPPVPDLIAAATPVTRGGRVTVRWPTKVGIIPNYLSGTSASAVARQAMAQTLSSVGCDVVDVTLPAEWDLLTGNAFNNVRLPERSEPFLEYLKEDVRLFGVSLTGWINGLFLSGDEFLKGQRAKHLLLERVLDDLFAQCDVVVQTGPVPFDILGLPEIAFPIGFGPETSQGQTVQGVPIGAILGAPPFGEERLLAVVAAYQAVTEFHLQRPADPVVSGARARAAGSLRITAEEVEATME